MYLIIGSQLGSNKMSVRMGIEAFGWHAPVLVVDLVAVAGRVDDVEPEPDAVFHND